MCKKLYRFINAEGETITVCKHCNRKQGRPHAVEVVPDEPTTCDYCFELFHPTLKEDLVKVRELVKNAS